MVHWDAGRFASQGVARCCGWSSSGAGIITLEYPQSAFEILGTHIGSTTANIPSQYHNESVLKKYQDRLKVGTLKESAKL